MLSFTPRSIVRAVAAGGVIVAVAAPTTLAAQGSGREGLEFSWSKAVPPGAQIVIRNVNGPITVQDAQGDRLEVRAVKNLRGRGRASDIGFDVRETGNSIEVCTLVGTASACGDRNRESSVRSEVAYTVRVPKSARLRVSTGNGRLTIQSAGDDLSASTGNGEILIGQTTGRVDASTGNGGVQIDGANGDVTVSTGNGRIAINTARGSVNASSGSGDIDVHVGALPIEHDMKLTTGSGAIRVALPADFNGRIDASTGSGTLRSEFEISIVGRLDASRVRGTIGRGGPLLRLTTGSGSIELTKN